MPVVGVQPPTGDGAVIKVEVDTLPTAGGDVYGEVRGTAASKVVESASDLFGEGLALARSCAMRVADALGQIAQESRPEEFTLQIAIKLDSQVGAVIAKASAGAQLQVQIKWKCDAKRDATGDAKGDAQVGAPRPGTTT